MIKVARFVCKGFDPAIAPSVLAAAKTFALIAGRRRYGEVGGYCHSVSLAERYDEVSFRYQAFIGRDKAGGCQGVDYRFTVTAEGDVAEVYSWEIASIVIEADRRYGIGLTKKQFGHMPPFPSWKMHEDGTVRLDGLNLETAYIWRDFHINRKEECPPSILRRIRELTTPPA
jgi:hypothetical protein